MRSPLVPLAIAGLLFAVLLRPVHDSDLFWQLRLGDRMLDAAALPTTEPFLATPAPRPFVPIAWGGQVVMALLRRLGGWPLLHIVDSLLWVGGFALAGWSARRTGAAGWCIGLAIALGGYAAFSSVSTRPQTFAVVAFGSWLLLLRGRPSPIRLVALGIPLLFFWQNLHPSATVGIIALAAFTGVDLLRWWRGSERFPWGPVILLSLAPLTIIATPMGISIFEITRHNAVISRWMQINEWLPLWDLEWRGDTRLEVWVALGISVFTVIRHRHRADLRDLAVAGVLLVMSLLSYRFVIFWALAMVPIWSRCWSDSTSPSAVNPWVAGVRFVALVSVAIVAAHLYRPSHLADYVPFRAIETLEKEALSGTIYCDTVWAGAVVDRDPLPWRVSHDGRYYLRPQSEWNHYFAAGAGEVPIANLVAEFHPVAFVLREQAQDGLIALLRRDSDWRVLIEEQGCVIFVRTSPSR